MTEKFTIALAGNPNTGKTTLFNRLTGARQHVGNYPGVTVEKKEGWYHRNGKQLRIVDLPGTYSLTAYSVEEVVARDYLVNERPQVVINIVDAANLQRHLYLTTQFMELGVPLVIALNMIDVAHDRGISVHVKKLAGLLGVPVVPIIARTGKGIDDLMQAAVEFAETRKSWEPVRISYGEDLDSAILEMSGRIEEKQFLTGYYPARWVAMKYLENDEQIVDLGRKNSTGSSEDNFATTLESKVHEVTRHLKMTMETHPEAMIADHRYGFIQSILRQGVITQKYDEDRIYASDKIDRIVTHRLIGPLIMAAVMLGLYHFTFTYSELPVTWLGHLFTWLGGAADSILPDGNLKSLIISGIIDGVGGVLGFVPLIMFMFFGIAILEDSGYLARVAFMMDRVFRIFGLHGSSVMSYIISGGIAGGCAVPGVMATRTLRSPKERMATLLTTPFMNCGAKLPVLALLIGTFFAANRAQFMLLLTLLAWVVALVVAKFLRLTVLRGEPTPFVMELPPYRLPTLKGLFIHTWEKTWQYIKKAGTVILGASILIWAMMTFPGLPDAQQESFAAKRQEIKQDYPPPVVQSLATGDLDSELPEVRQLRKRLQALRAEEAEQSLQYSLAGRMGRALESVSWLAGFNWRVNIALVGGVAAKEIVISTLGTAYSLGEVDPEESGSLARTLGNDPAWTPVMAFSLMIFIMFYSPCFVTVVCIAREAGTWKWGAFVVVFNTIFAFLLATLVYQAGKLFFS